MMHKNRQRRETPDKFFDLLSKEDFMLTATSYQEVCNSVLAKMH